MSGLFILLRKSIRSLAHAQTIARQHSSLKQVFIGVFSAVWLVSATTIFHVIFKFLHEMGGAGFVLIPRLFSLFFLGMGLMLVLSGGISGYAQLFQSRETRMLLTAPVPMRDVLYYKLIEASLLSSWAFFFIIVPFVTAYALSRDLSPWITLWTISFSIPYVLLCSSLGVLLALLVVRILPQSLWGKRGLLVLPVFLLGYILLQSSRIDLQSQSDILRMADMIPGIRFSTNPLLPSWWLSEGIMSCTRQDWVRGLMFLANLVFGCCVAAMAIVRIGEKIFYEGFQRIEFGGNKNIRKTDLLLERTLRFLPLRARDVRAFMTKDIRIFFRDPAQWSQALIFFGLLGLYFVNIRGVKFAQLDGLWRNLIGFLNVFSLSAVMCSLAARFIYPQLSLEGQGIWVVGLAPTSMRRVLFIKFFASAIALLVAGLVLTLLSSIMLKLSPQMISLTTILIACNAVGLAGMSNGLGALYLDTEIKALAAIISGFGGTLNLILGLLLITLTIIPLAMVLHLYTVGQISLATMNKGITLGISGALFLSLLASVIPMVLGGRYLEQRDY